jgi:hypothetical protein
MSNLSILKRGRWLHIRGCTASPWEDMRKEKAEVGGVSKGSLGEEQI